MDDDEESDSDFSESETMSDLTVDLRVLTSRAMRTFPRPPGQYDVAGPPAEATEFCRRSLHMYERFEQLKCGISSARSHGPRNPREPPDSVSAVCR